MLKKTISVTLAVIFSITLANTNAAFAEISSDVEEDISMENQEGENSNLTNYSDALEKVNNDSEQLQESGEDSTQKDTTNEDKYDGNITENLDEGSISSRSTEGQEEEIMQSDEAEQYAEAGNETDSSIEADESAQDIWGDDQNIDWDEDICIINGLKFEQITDDTVRCLGYSSDIQSEELKIPEKIKVSGNYYDVKSIGKYLKKDSEELVVKYGDSVETEEIFVLVNPNPINKVILPVTINEIDTEFLQNMTNLKDIEVDKGNSKYLSEDGILFNKNKSELLLYPHRKEKISYSIPSEVKKICNNCFRNCNNLEEVKLNEGLEEIEDEAFYNCAGIKNIEFPLSIKYVGNSCFYGCKNLQEVKLNSQLEKIGDRAFYSCASIEDIEISAVKNIGSECFCGCKNLQKVKLNGELEKIGDKAFYSCVSIENIEIPASVKNIGSECFYECTNLKEVKLNSGLEKIENKTFYKCSSLSSINIPDKVTSIGNEAFYGCESLKVIEIPSSVENISNYCFENCSLLDEIKLNEGLKKIEGSAFRSCTNLKTIDLPDSIISIGSYAFSGCKYLEEAKMPRCLTKIEKGEFSGCSNLKNITMPPALENIDYNSFKGCTSLESIWLPSSIKKIYANAFEDDSQNIVVLCSSSTYSSHKDNLPQNSIIIDVEMQNKKYYKNGIPDVFKVKADSVKWFEKNEGNSEYIEAESVLDSDGYSVYTPSTEKAGKKQVYFEAELNGNVYKSMSVDVEVYESDSIGSDKYNFGEDVWGENEEIKWSEDNICTINNINFKKNADNTITLKDCLQYADKILKIPSFIKVDNNYYEVCQIGPQSFCDDYNKSKVETLQISKNINYISDGAFGKYTFKEIQVDENNPYYTCENSVLFNKDKSILIKSCLADSEYNIPDTVNTIKSYAFYNNKLKSVIMSDNILDLEESAFENCAYLKSIKFSSNLKHIGKKAFAGCYRLEEITIPESVENIEDFAFEKCLMLKQAEILSKDFHMGKGMFLNCFSLNKVNFLEDNNNYSSDEHGVFNKDKTKLMTYFITNTEKTYDVPLTVTEIDDYAFCEACNLKCINIGKNVSDIGECVFEYCDNLQSINVDENNSNYKSIDGVLFNKSMSTILKYKCGVKDSKYIVPDSVYKIGKSAFAGSSNLQEVQLPSQLVNIGSMAFKNCSSLSKIELPESLVDIESEAFRNCRKLEDIQFKDNIRTIGDMAFNGDVLNDLIIPESILTIGREAFTYNIEDNRMGDILFLSSKTKIDGNKNIQFSEINERLREQYECIINNIISFQNVYIESVGGYYPAVWCTKQQHEDFMKCINKSLSFEEIVDLKTKYYRNDEPAIFESTSLFHFYEKLSDGSKKSIPVYKNGDMYIYKFPINECGIRYYYFVTPSIHYISHTSPLIPITVVETPPEENTTVGKDEDLQWNDDNTCTSDGFVIANDDSSGDSSDNAGGGVSITGGSSSASEGAAKEDTVIPSEVIVNGESKEVTSIGDQAFTENEGMKSITIPKTVTSIGDYVFAGCEDLENIYVSEENPNYSSENGVLFNKDKTELIAYPAGRKNSYYEIPATVAAIADSGFYQCKNIKVISIPSSVKTIGKSAFYGCEGLVDIEFNTGILVINPLTFSGCSSLENVILPEGIKTIGKLSFSRCRNLQSINIPDSVKKIESTAFRYCENLKTIYCSELQADKFKSVLPKDVEIKQI